MIDNDISPDNDVSVIIPAAGESQRMGGEVRKPFMTLDGEMILLRTCRKLSTIPGVFEVIVALHPSDVDAFHSSHWEEAKRSGITLVVAGGANRAQSVWNAIEVVSARAELIAVHDAVRPFVSEDVVKALFSTARRTGAAVPVLPLTDTPKRVEGDKITETLRRTGLMRVQTPQVFKSDLLIEAYEYAMKTGGLTEYITDDSQMVEALGVGVTAVYGNEKNFKLTSPDDIAVAEALLAAGML